MTKKHPKVLVLFLLSKVSITEIVYLFTVFVNKKLPVVAWATVREVSRYRILLDKFREMRTNQHISYIYSIVYFTKGNKKLSRYLATYGSHTREIYFYHGELDFFTFTSISI